MGNMLKREWFKRLIAVTLSLMVAVTFIPLLGDAAFAESEDGVDSNSGASSEILTEQDGFNDAEQPSEVPDADLPESESENDADIISDDSEDTIAEQSDTINKSDTTESDVEKLPVLGNSSEIKAFASNNVYTLTVTRKGSSLVLNGSFVGSYKYNNTTYTKAKMVFGEVFVDGKYVGTCSYKNKLSNLVISLSSVGSTGYRAVNINVYGVNSDNTRTGLWSTDDIYYRVGIFATPSANGSIAVYHNYLDYMSPVDGNLINYKLFLEYNGRVYGPMSYLQSAKITGLAPNSNYGIISYYGVYKDGSWFTGKEEGRYRNLGTYRTGVATTPKIKSIKVKATKVKKKTQKVYGYYTGLYLGKRKYYKYSIKITVKLKKAPGTNGIWINGKKFKGNKKKYTVKLGPYTNYSKPKGKKFTVMIYSYYNNSYGGYSPMYRTVKKVK